MANSQIGAYAFSAVAGGVEAELTGGNFWQEAATGLIIAGLNHAMHEIGNNQNPTQNRQKKEPWDLNGDGKMDWSEANNWYRIGNGQTVTLDANKIDLNLIDTKGWGKGKTYGIQTLFNSKDGMILGNITVKYLGNNQVTILPDKYNFEMHRGYLPKTVIRNVATVIGAAIAGRGTPFKINFKGINTIIPR